MNLEIDISEITNFGKRLQNYDKLETALMTATQEIARVVHKELLKRSPVETGNLRKMWSAGDNLLFYVDRKPDGFEVVLVNEAKNDKGYKYPWVVNYGHRAVNGRWVMGKFFVENSVAASEKVAKKIIRKELAKWFMGCINGK